MDRHELYNAFLLLPTALSWKRLAYIGHTVERMIAPEIPLPAPHTLSLLDRYANWRENTADSFTQMVSGWLGHGA